MVRSGYFRQYDYGSAEANLKHYNNEQPPFYAIEYFAERLKDVPILLAVGSNDDLSPKKDVDILVSMLPESAEVHYINDYNHLDYMWADDAKELLYTPLILPFLKKLNGTQSAQE